MNVTHLIAGSLKGGAARGALWLHRALLTRGIKSRVLSTHADEEGEGIARITPEGRIGDLWRKAHVLADVLPSWLYRGRDRVLFSSALWGYSCLNHAYLQDADIIHLHWVNSGMLSLRQIGALACTGKPLIWTLRDMWPLTGGCHYALECEKYKTGCGGCPRLHSAYTHDLSRLNNWRKRRLVKKIAAGILQPVAISSWLAECAQESAIFSGFSVPTIFNCVDLDDFKPRSRAEARAELGWPQDEKIILCGAFGIASPWKGFAQFMQARELLPAHYKIALFGDTHTLTADQRQRVDYDLGVLRGAQALQRAYAAANVFAAPSLQEAFGKTLIEAMACATPVVGFAATGPKDIVTHRKTGWLAHPFEAADYAKGLCWCCENNDENALGFAARRRVEDCFAPMVIARQYIDLYNRASPSACSSAVADHSENYDVVL